MQGPPGPPPGYGPPPGPGYGPPAPNGYGPPPKPKGMSGLTIALIVFGVVLLLGFGGCVVCVGLGAVASSSSSTTSGPKTPPVVVDIHTLLDDYRDNEVHADAAYKDKWIQTTGMMVSVGDGVLGGTELTIGSGEYVQIPALVCELDDANKKKAAGITKNQLVTVTGHVDGKRINVVLSDCSIAGP